MMRITTTFATPVVAAVLIGSLAFAPSLAAAQSTYGQAYESMTTQEKIAYLYGMIAQLQMLLELMLEAEEEGGTIGVPRPSRGADVSVSTLSARDIEAEEAELRGEIDLEGEDEALVWFEYGEDDDDLDERTTKRRITDSRGDERTFDRIIDDLDEDERYYFRAVAEDEDGDRDYGSIRSFRTDEDDDDYDDDSVSSGDFELRLSDTSIDAGDEIEVDWEIPSDEVGSQNWIGLYEEGDSNSSYVDWEYIDDDDTGSVTFRIDDEGDYEIRLFLDNSYTVEIESDVIEVN